MRTTRRLAPLAALVAMLVLAGCGAGNDGGDGDAADEAAPAQAEQEAGDEAGAGDAPAEDAGEQSGDDRGGIAGGALVDDRSVIYTGDIAVRVEDVTAAAREVTVLADRYGGFVGEDHRESRQDDAYARIVLRIPSEDFTAAVEALGELGQEQRRGIQTEDVTEEVVDLEARIATAQASVDRTRELLEQAESISDVVSVEQELADREAELASLQARQRELADLTALSTITVELLGPETEAPEPEEPELGFFSGLGAGWDAFTSSLRVLVTVFGALLPWLVAAALPAGAVVWWARRRRTPARTPLEAGAPPES